MSGGSTGAPDRIPSGLVLRIELLTGSFDAARADDREVAEWPPHPSRLFCALVSVTRTDAERAVLRWLEEQEPPEVHAVAPVGTRRHQRYVVTNLRDATGGSTVHPGRTNHLWARRRTLVGSPIVHLVWPGARPPAGAIEILDTLARRVPYLGRSTGAVLIAVQEGPLRQERLVVVYRPCDLAEAEVDLGVPYPGYLGELTTLHHQGRPAWEALRTRGYRCRRSAARPAGRHPATPPGADSQVAHHPGDVPAPAPVVADLVAGDLVAADLVAADPVAAEPVPGRELVVMRLADLRPDGRQLIRFTGALRRKVMACTPDPLPPALHGHVTDGRPHIAFLGLPEVGVPGADGHLRALALVLPSLPAEQRRAILFGLLYGRDPDGTVPLRVPGVGTVRLRPVLAGSRPVRAWAETTGRSASPPPGCWAPSWRRASRCWSTVTPVVLDRFPRPGSGGEAGVLLRSLRVHGLPDPQDLQISVDPQLPGAVAMRPRDLPDSARGRLFRHVTLTFDHPVPGPLLLGAGRYLGVGLFAPCSRR